MPPLTQKYLEEVFFKNDQDANIDDQRHSDNQLGVEYSSNDAGDGPPNSQSIRGQGFTTVDVEIIRTILIRSPLPQAGEYLELRKGGDRDSDYERVMYRFNYSYL